MYEERQSDIAINEARLWYIEIPSKLDIKPPPFPQAELAQAFANGFALVWNALTGRSTSKPEDIFLILANMLDLKCGPLHHLSSEERLQNIIFSLPYSPLSLLFIREKRGFQTYPLNTWVPAKLGLDLLARGSQLQFRFLEVNLEGPLMRVCPSGELQQILVKDARLLNLAEFKQQVSSTDSAINCKVASSDRSQPSLGYSEAVCIPFEGDLKKPLLSTRGAILRVISQTSKTTQLAYHRSIVVEKQPGVQAECHEDRIFYGDRLCSDHKFLIRYGQ